MKISVQSTQLRYSKHFNNVADATPASMQDLQDLYCGKDALQCV